VADRGSVLLVRLTHRYMTATVHELVRRGYRVRALGNLEATRFLAPSDGIDTSPPRRTRAVPEWWPIPALARTILEAMDDDCVLVITKGGKEEFRAAWLATRIRRVGLVFRTESDAYWDPTSATAARRALVAGQRLRRRVRQAVLRTPGFTPRHGPGTARLRDDLTYLPAPVTTQLDVPPTLPDLPLRVLTITRCLGKKNNRGLLALMTALREEAVEFRVIFSDDASCHRCHGEGPAQFQEQVTAAGLQGVTVSGPVGDVTPYYRASHVLLRNSTYEGANTTPMEGAAQGCIPVVSTGSGTAYGFVETHMGVRVEAEDLATQVDVLRGLTVDVERRERMRAAALRAAKERCDPGILVDLLEAQMR
jgi:glycosyltransferase involved in cell wall biosynthesis